MKEKIKKFILVLFASVLFSFILCLFGCTLGYSFARGYSMGLEDSAGHSVSVQSLSPCDTVVSSFSSSNFPFLVSSFNISNWAPSTSNVVTSRYIPFRFTFDSDNLRINYYDDIAYENENKSYSLVADNNWYNSSFLFSLSSNQYIFISYRCGVGFNFNVVRALIGSDSGYRGNFDYASSFIEFYDSNNVGLRILFCFAPTYGGYNYGLWNSLTERTYYFISDITDNDFYYAGVDYGKQLGRDEVWQSRYDDGFYAGRIVGDGEGYIRGVNDANTYTFFNLFGALFDVPVRIVTGFLNFDFLGQGPDSK